MYLRLSYGPDDDFDSRFAIFRRNSCYGPDLLTRAKLSERDLREIADLARTTGFFELPRELPSAPQKFVNGEEVFEITGPCFDSYLEIDDGVRANRVKWDCNTSGNPDEEPKPIRVLLELLDEKVYGLQSVRALAEPDCRYH